MFVITIPSTNAQRGCCSHHGGVAGCGSNGKQICNDGTYSPTCTCSGETNSSSSSNYYSKRNVYGCTDPKADNYNNKANKDNGSCKYTRYGCINEKTINYNNKANISDNSCQFEKEITKTKKIKYKTIYKENTNLKYKENKTIKKGKKGIKQIVYKIVVNEDNNEISRTKVKEAIIKEPVNKIIERNKTKKKTIVDFLLKKQNIITL